MAVLRYVSNGGFILNVPAKDLDSADMKNAELRLKAEGILFQDRTFEPDPEKPDAKVPEMPFKDWLIQSGLYEAVSKPKPEEKSKPASKDDK